MIVDDESHICMELEYTLKQFKELEIIGICSSTEDALEVISQSKPDIILLDISMPGMDGIKLGRYLKKIEDPPYIIYITAYEEYAVDAFKIGAKGYLLKPFSDEDINEIIRYAINELGERKTPIIERKKLFTRISGELDGKFYLLDQEDITMAYAQQRNVYFKANGKDYKTHFLLSELEKNLNPNMFFRCHRGYVINLYKIKEITPWFNNTYLLKMDDQSEAPVSRNFIKELKSIIGL